MSLWTLTYNGTEKACADWGLTARPVIRTRDRSETTISFWMAGAAPEAGAPFPFQAQVIIRQNRTLVGGAWTGTGYVFTGYMQNPKATVRGNQQGLTITFADAIWLLKNTAFQQAWSIPNGGGTLLFSRCVLFMNINSWIPNQFMSVQWQIQQLVAWAATCGISLQAGTIDYSTWFLNYYHCRAVSIWDALLKCLEPVADAKVWIDGSTNPPSLNVRTRANLAALAAPTGTGPGPITLPYKGTDRFGRTHFSSMDFTPRYDLVPLAVVLQYQTNNTIGGQSVPLYQTDAWPVNSTGQTPFALVAPIDLTGAVIVSQSAHLDCEALACVGGTQASKRTWWASKRGGEQTHLADYRVRFQDTTGAATTLPDATVVDDNGNPINLAQYPNRIVKGTFHAWMAQLGYQAVRAKIYTTAQYAEYDVVGSTPAETDTNGNRIKASNAHQLVVHCTLTNAPTGLNTYNAQNLKQAAETPVANLAQNIYNSRATLDYDGSHEIIDPGNSTTAALTQLIGHWNVLNLTGGAAAWATANMTIAGTEIDLMTNHQRIEVGPSKHLQPQEWNAMLQFFRYRRIFIPSSTRATGVSDPNNTVDEPQNTPDANSVTGLNVDAAIALLNYSTPTNPASAINSGLMLDTTALYSLRNL